MKETYFKHETLFDVSALKQERNTWRLIGRLYHDELMQAQNTNDSIANMENSTFEKEFTFQNLSGLS